MRFFCSHADPNRKHTKKKGRNRCRTSELRELPREPPSQPTL